MVTSRPYYPKRGELIPEKVARSIVEIPWPYAHFIAKFPAAGGPVLRFFGAKYVMLGLNQSLKRGDTVFYLHPIDMTDERFPLNDALVRRLFWFGKGKHVEKRLRYVLEHMDARIVTMRELIETRE
jgi:hypothetical protein